MEINRKSPPKYRAYKRDSGNPYPNPAIGALKITRLKIAIETLTLHSRIHVCPNQRNGASRNPATLVREFDGDVLLSFHHHHLDERKVALVLHPESFDDGAERVLEQLEADVGEVPGDVGESEILRAYELDGGTLEHRVVLFANKSGILDGLLDDVVHICLCANDANIILMRLMGVESNVLAN